MALSTEYRSKTTHTSDEDKFSKFVNKEANKNKLAAELGISSSAIEIDTVKDILTYRDKKYTLDNLGGITNYTPKQIAIGEEITIEGENFYVLKRDNGILTLFAKYNLAKNTNANGKYYQEDADYETTEFRFSNSNYWSGDYVYGTRINLNTWETIYGKITPNTENLNNNAILRARKYGEDIGGIGRLLTYDESCANGATNCLFGTSNSDPLRNVLYSTYFWMATTDEKNSSRVWALARKWNGNWNILL